MGRYFFAHHHMKIKKCVQAFQYAWNMQWFMSKHWHTCSYIAGKSLNPWNQLFLQPTNSVEMISSVKVNKTNACPLLITLTCRNISAPQLCWSKTLHFKSSTRTSEPTSGFPFQYAVGRLSCHFISLDPM